MKRTLIVNGRRHELSDRQLVEVGEELSCYQAAGVEVREFTRLRDDGSQRIDYEVFTLDWDPAPSVVLELWSPLLIGDDADIREPGFVRRFYFGRRTRARVTIAAIPLANEWTNEQKRKTA